MAVEVAQKKRSGSEEAPPPPPHHPPPLHTHIQNSIAPWCVPLLYFASHERYACSVGHGYCLLMHFTIFLSNIWGSVLPWSWARNVEESSPLNLAWLCFYLQKQPYSPIVLTLVNIERVDHGEIWQVQSLLVKSVESKQLNFECTF